MNSIQSLLYTSILAHADRTAILSSQSEKGMTYAQLYDQSSSVAGYLQDLGFMEGDYVVLALSRSNLYIVAVTACLLFGYGAVLMDAAYPSDRIQYAAKNANAKLIIDDMLMSKIIVHPKKAQYKVVSANCPAVVFYTSGSTGNPKGILHDQGSICCAAQRYQSFLKTSPEDIEGIFSSFTFVAGLIAFLNPFCAGASVTIIPREVIGNPFHLSEFIDQMNISQLFMPPSVLKLFKPKGHSLRVVTTGSERVSGIAPCGFHIYNLYGMSETNAAVTAFPIDKAYMNTPIGKAIEGCAVYLLDENGNESNEGEICVAGYFMTCYIGLHEKTAQVRVNNPFFIKDGHKTMIRTGDLGRRDEDGNIIYVNRKDWMIKINGQRVEPGEIEAALKAIPQISNAAVKGFINESGHSYLTAYYVANDEIEESEIRMTISKKLPHYMMPAYFIKLDQMPFNANGKLNRLALKEPSAAFFASDYVSPANDMEKRLCDCMAHVLEIEKVGVHDDFFMLGGDSIGCMALIAQLNDPRIGTKLIYTARTPKAIAQSLLSLEIENDDALNHIALSMDQPLIPYQVYYLDYQLYSPKQIVTNLPFMCSFPRDQMDAKSLKRAVEKVTRHFAIFGTVFLFNEANQLIQRYCPEMIPEIDIVYMSEEELNARGKHAFFKPFQMLNHLLWRSQIAVTEENVHLFLDFSHAISDGAMAMRVFHQIFEALERRELQKDYYYLFLRKYALFMETPEGRSELNFVRKLYAGDWSKFPKPDFDTRENTNERILSKSIRTAKEYKALASIKKVSLGTALVTAGQLALSRFNREKKVAVEWIYNGRNEKWKNDLIGITICGVPATMDFEKHTNHKEILSEARRQNEWGLRYAEHSFALNDMSPTQNECLKIVYEHGITIPDTIPKWARIKADTEHFTGMLGLFQILIFESADDEPLDLIATYQGSRYRKESAHKMLFEFKKALDELLIS